MAKRAAQPASGNDLPILAKPTARVGLLGGTFDPVHLGHLAVAQAALDSLKLDHLFFIPAAQAPLRSGPPGASAQDRLQLLKLALAEAGDSRLGVLDVETRAGGVNYTVDTVRRLRAVWPQAKFFWVLGADQFAQLDRWREPAELAKLVELAVYDRPGSSTTPPAALAKVLRWQKLPGAPQPIRAEEIRRRLLAGQPVGLWLPRRVAAAIEEMHLYPPPPTAQPPMPEPATDSRRLVRLCCQALDDKKAVELRVLDVSGRSSITDYLIIATATSGPHLKALRGALEDALEAAGARVAGVEYSNDSGWLVVDAYQLMAHLFLPDQRGYFSLEALWRDARPVDVRALLAGN